MATNNNNQAQAQAFWDFIRSMQSVPNMPPPPHEGAEGHPPPPPPPFGPFGGAGPFGSAGPFGAFGPDMFFGPPSGRHGGPHHGRHGGPGGFGERHGRGDFSEEEWDGERRRHRHNRRSRPNMRQTESGNPQNDEEQIELLSDEDVVMEKDGEKQTDGQHTPQESRTATPEQGTPEDGPRGPRGHHGRGCRRGSPPPGMFGGRGGRGFGGRGGGGRGGPRGGHGGRGGPQGMHGMHHRGHHERRGGPRMHGRGRNSFDMSGLHRSLSTHPWAQAFRPFAEANGFGHLFANEAGDGVDTRSADIGADSENFEPPVDVFSTAESWILHVALPGAKKEDIGVNWDADKGELSIAGVVHRPGDEEFLKGLLSSERRVGAFERTLKLPPGEEAESEEYEVDGDGIIAKLEDGVLAVTVPKLERLRSWTDVKKVDIL